MTEQILEQAIKIKKKLKEERECKKELGEIIECTGKELHNAEFRITARISGTMFVRSTLISHTVAMAVLNREMEDTIKHIASLEAELEGLH